MQSSPETLLNACRGDLQPLLLEAVLHKAGHPLVLGVPACPQGQQLQPLRVPGLQAGTKATKPSSGGTGEHRAVLQACA